MAHGLVTPTRATAKAEECAKVDVEADDKRRAKPRLVEAAIPLAERNAAISLKICEQKKRERWR